MTILNEIHADNVSEADEVGKKITHTHTEKKKNQSLNFWKRKKLSGI